jgi:hypothetical protein
LSPALRLFGESVGVPDKIIKKGMRDVRLGRMVYWLKSHLFNGNETQSLGPKRNEINIPSPAPAIEATDAAEAELANKEGLELFRRGAYGRALEKFSMHLCKSNRADLISRMADEVHGVFGGDSSDESIGRYIDRRLAAWRRGETGRPRFLAKRPSVNLEALKGVKILLVFARYICNDSRFMQNDMIDHFYETAIRAGLQADVFFVDECSYPGLAPTPRELALAKLDELKDRIKTSRPDIVFFDAQYIGTDVTLSSRFVEEIQEKFHVQAIGAICDAWQNVCVPMADYWLPAVRALYHFAPASPMETQSSHPEKLVWSGFPVNRAQFHNSPEKNVPISFSGTYDFGNRAFWLSVAARAAAEFDIQGTKLVGHDRQEEESATIEDYAETMRQSKIVLNFPMRYNGEYAVTGRIWQALHCGALLLEEYTELTEAYFVPYVHYMPFRSAEELRRLIRFFHENEEYARLIGDNAAKFMEVEYSERRIWADILSKAIDSKHAGVAAQQ